MPPIDPNNLKNTNDMKLPYPTFQEAQVPPVITPNGQAQLQQQYQAQLQLQQQIQATQHQSQQQQQHHHHHHQQQKRKRVTRACDECRKKKVKCDGQQPCIHCTVYSYDCTYDQPSNRKKNVAELHVIEHKLKTAEQILHLLFPHLDVLDDGFDFDTFEDIFNKNRDSVDGLDKISILYKQKAPSDPSSASSSNANTPSTSSTPQSGYFNTIGKAPSSAGTAFTGKQQSSSIPPAPERPSKKPKLNYPHSHIDGSIESKDGREIKIILPPKNVALDLVTKMWASPCVLFRFYHRPSFIRDLDDLYDTDPENYTNKQNKFLPLAYSVMAVGALFSKKNGVDDKFLEDEGYRYFVAARKLIDITDARDIYAIQTIVTLVLFLQCSARLSTCYSYIGVALRSALREGLHRKSDRFDPLENEVRKRIFWTIYKMDIYVNGMLGLPRSIAPEDIDQEMPVELDDENITEEGLSPQEEGKLSSTGISNKHTELILVLNKIAKNLYPITNNLKNLISHEKVSEMELELRAWLSNLPKELIPGYDPPFQYYKANRLLHLSFLHVQIVLYRPFIHYISPRYTNKPQVDQLSVQRAKNCISVARTCVKLAQDMINKNMLSGSYWFSIYSIFFSVACLVYYVHEVPMDEFHPDYVDIKRDAETGKKILTVLKDSSMAASRIYNILNSLFEQLNRRTVSLHSQQEQNFQTTQNQQQPAQYQQQIQQHFNQQQQQQSIPQEQSGALQTPDQNNNTIVNLQTVPVAQNLVAATSSATANNTVNTNVQNTGNIDGDNLQINDNTADFSNAMNDFDHLANFDSFINQPINATGSNNNGQAFEFNMQEANNGNPLSQNSTGGTNASNNNYLPGMMDQLDMQIFGRFLPPYMLKRKSGEVGPGINGGDLPSGLQSTNDINLESLDGFKWDDSTPGGEQK